MVIICAHRLSLSCLHTLLPVAPSSSGVTTAVVNVSSLSHGSKGLPKVFSMELAPGAESRPQAAAKNWSKGGEVYERARVLAAGLAGEQRMALRAGLCTLLRWFCRCKLLP